MTKLIFWLRWGWPRKPLLKLYLILPNSLMRDQLGEFLIPGDAVITFPERRARRDERSL